MKTLRSVFTVLILFLVAACAGPKDVIVLLADENGKVGEVTVQSTDGSKVVLNKALASAEVGAGDLTKGQMVQDRVDVVFKDVLSALPQNPVSFILYFRTGGTVLTEASKPVLKKLFDAVANRQAAEIQVTGHTDRVGSAGNNDKLALKRAQAVAQMLIDRGIKTKRVRAVGRGERAPLVPTKDGKREPKNRRVEVIVR
ncbi:MAG: OmpA family protein [Rhodospirillaceae bacterium]|jgi:outer membrane protein OmpA-like peptidoglycan-associated protein|nr:OmpA family protein [Rhodospirillales bacterium]MBT3904343.1 OmpA family protein [Rhodospirillaceae bacterium]MBT4703549.1 OmpA family protein [Rhodospirillaceae bacterium]MBT5036708.1 OmpA family protein [Rhodospirillaceae bacterium]MBT6220204.1 OmpA family protein [Rhodospirillaceae bacterium]